MEDIIKNILVSLSRHTLQSVHFAGNAVRCLEVCKGDASL